MHHSSGHSEHNKDHMRGTSGGYERLDAHPFDRFETKVLTIARMFFVSFHLPKRQSWVNAFQFGQDNFGRENGAVITKSVLDVVNTMRQTRNSGFGYCDPHCAECSLFLTREERYLISTLHHLKRNSPAAALNAMLLCEGADTSRFIARCNELNAYAGGAGG